MARNGRNLHEAKVNKNDEFYTLYDDVDKEVTNYSVEFNDKVVYCNCDNPLASNFFKFFLSNFKILNLKKLICTCYDHDNPPQSHLFIDTNEAPSKAYKVVVTDLYDYDGDGRVCVLDAISMIKDSINNGKNVEGISIDFLEPDDTYCAGDFRSRDCVELLKECDIVCTNPPFSIFREFVALLEKYNKKYLIIGNQDAITYKEIFPLIKENKLWTGYNHPSDFVQPNGEIKKFGNILWYTNLDTYKRHIDIPFNPFKTYNEIDYPKYDNYDAIEVSKVKDYPNDYFGIAGVPITFLDKYNPDQFELIGLSSKDNCGDVIRTHDNDYYRGYTRGTVVTRVESNMPLLSVSYCGGTRCNREGSKDIYQLFWRLFVRRKK